MVFVERRPVHWKLYTIGTGQAFRNGLPVIAPTAQTRIYGHARPLKAGRHAKTALEIARRLHERDLEITALGRLGLAEVRVGAVESGMSRMDEAMAAALGGEGTELETLGELCCDLIAACDQTGDVDRLRQWNRLLGEATHERHELPVMTFCGCCSAEALIAGGHLEDAERELARALRIADQTGARGRCVDPRAREDRRGGIQNCLRVPACVGPLAPAGPGSFIGR